MDLFLLVPIGVAGAVLTVLKARKSGRTGCADAGDRLRGAALLVVLTIVLTLLLYWRSAELVGLGQKGFMGLLFVGLLGGFLVYERRARHPVVNFESFKIQMFTFSVLSLLVLFDVQHRPHLPAAVLHAGGRAPPVALVHGAHLPLSAGLHGDPGRCGRSYTTHRKSGRIIPASIRRADELGGVPGGRLPESRLALDAPGRPHGVHGAGTALPRHSQPDGDRRVGAAEVPWLCHGHGADGLRPGLAARDLARRPAADRGLPLLRGPPRRHPDSSD